MTAKKAAKPSPAKSKVVQRLKNEKTPPKPKFVPRSATDKPKPPPKKKKKTAWMTPRNEEEAEFKDKVLSGRHPKFWMLRSSHGRKPIFKTPESLWEACVEYFNWVEDNPLLESKTVSSQGQAHLIDIPKMRAMSLTGLCIFIDISPNGWKKYAERDEFTETCQRVADVIYTQKFEGVAADLLSPMVICRDLGLRDKVDTVVDVPPGGPLATLLEQIGASPNSRLRIG